MFNLLSLWIIDYNYFSVDFFLKILKIYLFGASLSRKNFKGKFEAFLLNY